MRHAPCGTRCFAVADGLPRNFTPGQGWMGASRFLEIVRNLGGPAGMKAVEDAIWAYTAAAIDHLGRSVADARTLKALPPDRRFAAWLEMAGTLKKCVADQIRLLHDVEGRRAGFESGIAALKYGRKLMAAVHRAPQRRDAPPEGFPEGRPVPDTSSPEWKEIVRAAEEVLKYNEKYCGRPGGRRGITSSR